MTACTTPPPKPNPPFPCCDPDPGCPCVCFEWVGDCDWAAIEADLLEAFCGGASWGYIIPFNRAATEAVPQNSLALAFSDVNDPKYDPEIAIPLFYQPKPTEEDIKKFGISLDAQKDYVKIETSVIYFRFKSLNYPKIEDRIRIPRLKDGALLEIISILTPRGMGGLTAVQEILCYTVKGGPDGYTP